MTTSLVQDEGIHQLEDAIQELFYSGSLEQADLTYVSNVRHIVLLKEAHRTIAEALEAAEIGVPIDMVQIDLTRTWELLGEIVGDTMKDSLINELFSQFCLGK